MFALGPPEVRLGERLLTFPTRKTLALLFYLAIEGGMQPRKYLAALLWPESNPERSQANLRNTLGHLQTALRRADDQLSPLLSITHHVLGLNPDANINFDLRTVESAYKSARADRSNRMAPEVPVSLPLLQSAAACQRGDFLTGFSLGDAPGFDDWVAIQREVWHRQMGLILDRLSEIQFARGEFARVTDTTSHWIALDMLNEVAYRRKMRAHFAAGERGQALETYEICRAVLAAELDIEPEPDTATLAERIRTQPSPAHPERHLSADRSNTLDTSVAFLGSLFAGRTSEFQTLVNSYERVKAAQPQLVILRGEAGIGKTRLAQKFLSWARAQGAELLQSSAFESGIHFPFQPLVEVLRQRLEHKNSLLDLLGDVWFSSLSQVLPELRHRFPSLSSSFDVDPRQAEEQNQAKFPELFVEYTLALAERAPLVLFVDDLQWTDSATLDLLHYVIRRWQGGNARAMLLVALRSEAQHSMVQTWERDSPSGLSQWLMRVARELLPVRIELEPLGQQETLQMMMAILLEPAADFAQWVYEETHGQPFYLMETLKDLLERRVLQPKRQGEGQWAFGLDADHDLAQAVRVPSTVYAVIRSRLNRLSPNAFSLLAGAAVLEHKITFKGLCAISTLTEDLALPALDELISGRLLLEAAQSGTVSTYSFINDMLRDVVYTEAGDARRRLFHQRALETLEAAKEPAAVLAHHAQAAGLVQAAFHHSLAAGQEAWRISAVNEAVAHFEYARQLVREASLPEKPDWVDLQVLYAQLKSAYQLSGQQEKALAIDAERSGILGQYGG